jgi:hypothetical protein
MIDLGILRQMVENNIDAYRYEVPEAQSATLGPNGKVSAYLRKMREALVEPLLGGHPAEGYL